MGFMKDIAMQYGSMDNFKSTLSRYEEIQRRRANYISESDKILISLVKADEFSGKYIYCSPIYFFAKKDQYEVGDVLYLSCI